MKARLYKLANIKFQLNTVQHKVSFIAYSKGISLKELFFRAIIITFMRFRSKNKQIIVEASSFSKKVDFEQTKMLLMRAINEYISKSDSEPHAKRQRFETSIQNLKEIDLMIDSLSDAKLSFLKFYN